MIRTQTDPTINAIATLLVSLTVVSCLIAMAVTKYRG